MILSNSFRALGYFAMDLVPLYHHESNGIKLSIFCVATLGGRQEDRVLPANLAYCYR